MSFYSVLAAKAVFYCFAIQCSDKIHFHKLRLRQSFYNACMAFSLFCKKIHSIITWPQIDDKGRILTSVKICCHRHNCIAFLSFNRTGEDISKSRYYDQRIAVCANSIDIHMNRGVNYVPYDNEKNYYIPLSCLISKNIKIYWQQVKVYRQINMPLQRYA